MKKLLISFAIALCACSMATAQGFNEAKALYANGEYDQARDAFAKLLRAAPNNAAYNYWHGLATMQCGNLQEAKKSLEKSAKRKHAESYFALGKLNELQYDFDAAVDNFEDYIAQIAKPKGNDSERERADEALERASLAQMMMRGVEKVNVIDSVVIDKQDFLQIYRLGSSAGQLSSYADFFTVPADSADERTVYEPELGNAIIYSDKHQGGLSLYRSAWNGTQWTKGTLLPEPVTAGGTQNYPYMLSDGLTLYYASDEPGGLGGYDIYVTAYNTASETYVQPQNIGMPFNSQFNDYMFVLDEQNNLGWFASDRYQPEGLVCVYVFVPNDSKLVYDPEETDPGDLRKAASLVGFHDVQPSPDAADAGLARLQAVLSADAGNKRRADFVFVVNDERTYTSIYDFMSKDAQDLFAKRQKLKQSCKDMQEELDKMRAAFRSATQEKRETMVFSITDLEQRIEQMQDEEASLDMQIRNAEIKKIKEMKL